MNYLMIENQGELDPRGITLIGASAKISTTAIGEFGSGLCYALATLLRANIGVRIFAGEREIAIDMREEDFRGKIIKVIYIDGQATSLTASLGPKWLIEHAIREIWSNAIDEGGHYWDELETVSGEAGKTRFFIEFAQSVRYMVRDWNSWFLTDDSMICKNSHAEVHHTQTNRIYRRGVLCTSYLANTELLFSYNFRNVSLPESREVTEYDALYQNRVWLGDLDDPEFISAITAAAPNREMIELGIISYSGKAAHAIRKWVKDQGYTNILPKEQMPTYRGNVNKVFWVHYSNWPELRRMCENDLEPTKEWEELPMHSDMRQRLDEAVQLLADNSIEFPPDVKIVFGKTENTGIIAQYFKEEATVLLTKAAFEDDDMLIRALVEEWTHAAHGVLDHSIAQQHIYLETIVRLIRR